MIKRAIVIFPEFEDARLIEDLRARYDPLVAVIPAHITLAGIYLHAAPDLRAAE